MIEIVAIGSQGLACSRMALGCMGMSEFYVGSTSCESRSTIENALRQGVTMFDTADMYGPFTNEQLVGTVLRRHRQHVIIATKFGYVRSHDGTRIGLNGRPEYVVSACNASLRRLRTTYIDLYYLHRRDRTVPIEETVGAMGELVKAGKVRFLGLSEVSTDTVRRAHQCWPISAVQTEYSLLSREPEVTLFDTLAAMQIGFVGYAPLARGLLSDRFRTEADIPPLDYRRTTPRFMGDNLAMNNLLVSELQRLAASLKVTPSQLALAWANHQVPNDGAILVGTTSAQRLRENVAAMQLKLGDDVMQRLDRIFPRGAAKGDRYPDMSRVEQ